MTKIKISSILVKYINDNGKAIVSEEKKFCYNQNKSGKYKEFEFYKTKELKEYVYSLMCVRDKANKWKYCALVEVRTQTGTYYFWY